MVINKATTQHQILQGDCREHLTDGMIDKVDLTFFDPPYNQGKAYQFFNDQQNPKTYWAWIREILQGIHQVTGQGGGHLFHAP